MLTCGRRRTIVCAPQKQARKRRSFAMNARVVAASFAS